MPMISRIRFGPWRRFYARFQGAVDGRRGEPEHSRPPMSDAEQQMVRIARGCVDSVYEIGEKKDRDLKATCKSRAIKTLESEAHFISAEQEYKAAKDKLHGYLDGNGQGSRVVIPRSQLNWRTYIALMSVLGVGEGAFSFIVFQVFRENLPFTFLMSLAVMAGLPALLTLRRYVSSSLVIESFFLGGVLSWSVEPHWRVLPTCASHSCRVRRPLRSTCLR